MRCRGRAASDLVRRAVLVAAMSLGAPHEAMARQTPVSVAPSPARSLSASDSTRVRRRVEKEIAAFLLAWRRAWQSPRMGTTAQGGSGSGAGTDDSAGRDSSAGGRKSAKPVNVAAAAATTAQPKAPPPPPPLLIPKPLIDGGDIVSRALPVGMRSQLLRNVPWSMKGSTAGVIRRRPRDPASIGVARTIYIHCHPDVGGTDELPAFAYPAGYSPLVSLPSYFGKCPTWLLDPDEPFADEAQDLDAYLGAQRPVIRTLRSALIASLKAARDSIPEDGWLLGQHIRFLVDQDSLGEAELQARGCEVSDWLCPTLVGYVLAKGGRVVSADSAFGVGVEALPMEQACSWADVRVLLSEGHARVLDAMSCEQRLDFATRLWWLSDPLFAQPGNERRVEHFARKTMVMLHSALEQDERNHWRADDGGVVVSTMMTRYGWPTIAAWSSIIDVGHDNYLRFHTSSMVPPYTNAEYSPGRVHFVPELSALREPFGATPNAWQLRPPSGFSEDMFAPQVWWPSEHAEYRNGAMLQLPDGQAGIFRRQSRNRIILAVDVQDRGDTLSIDEWTALLGDESTTTLFASPGPDSAFVVARQRGVVAGRLALDGALPLKPAVMSLEMVGNGPGKGAARTRFGITPPEPLASLPRGSIAVSDPVLFTPAGNGALPADVDAMKPLMLGRTFVTGAKQIGVFWETYGVPAGDSVRIAIDVSPVSDPSLLRRIGSALRLLDRPADGIAIAWQDPQDAPASATAASGGVPIYPRSLLLNIQALPKGDYWIDVTVSSIGRGAATSRGALSIR